MPSGFGTIRTAQEKQIISPVYIQLDTQFIFVEWISARNSNEGRSFRLKLSSRGCLARFHGRSRTKAGPGDGCGEEGGTCTQE